MANPMQNPMDFSGHVALVTGGNQGIGKAIVDLFLDQGAKVVVLDIALKPPESRKNCSYFSCDIAHESQVEQTLKKVIQEFPEVSILVNNAGITDDKVFWKMSTEQWQRVLQVNLTGAFWMSRTMARHFRELERGTIVNISSINGLRGKFGQANYSAAKGGLVALTKTMARELGRFHITANCIAPGMVKTPMTDKLDPEINDRAREESPLGEIAQPEQIAQAVLFLCSPWARHITGTVLKVDGGQYI